jgi:hypothetical protein
MKAIAQLAVVLALFFAALAHAQLTPADVPEVAPVGGLPDAPAGFVRQQRGSVLWEIPGPASSTLATLQDSLPGQWRRIERELGVDVEDALIIRVGLNPEQMNVLGPRDAPPPPYASGVAYPARGLVLLTLTAPETWERPDMQRVLTHELSHIALHRAVEGHQVPRWFTEGVAIHLAGEASMERVRTLWEGTVGGRLLPLERLSGDFPSRPNQVNLAYAQSADFVRWLLDRDDGSERFARLLARVRDGEPFERAFEHSFGSTLAGLELRWHDDLSERFQALIWTLISILILFAYWRRRRQNKARLAQWEAEERAAIRAAQVLLTHAEPDQVAPGPSPTRREEEVMYVMPPEPRLRDSGVPTVEHEGRSYTLH